MSILDRSYLPASWKGWVTADIATVPEVTVAVRGQALDFSDVLRAARQAIRPPAIAITTEGH